MDDSSRSTFSTLVGGRCASTELLSLAKTRVALVMKSAATRAVANTRLVLVLSLADRLISGSTRVFGCADRPSIPIT